MVENIVKKTSKKTWYKWTLYINIILFFIVALFIYYLVKDVGVATTEGGVTWLYVSRDIAFIAVALALIFVQFIRNLFIIMRRSL